MAESIYTRTILTKEPTCRYTGAMQTTDKKAAIAAYKERKPAAGIYALRCTATGECWVGRASDLSTIRNRVDFMLRQASTPHRELAAAIRAHGPEGFTFEVLEQLKDDLSPSERDRLLKRGLEHWTAALGAKAV